MTPAAGMFRALGMAAFGVRPPPRGRQQVVKMPKMSLSLVDVVLP